MEDAAGHVAALVGLTLAGGTPLVFAALGELVTEKSGVLNLGVEGMMLVGAVVSFIVAATTRQPWLGALAGAAAGTAMAAIFGTLTLSLMANQVATGLALSLFGVGLSAFIGQGYVSVVIDGIKPLSIPGLSEQPIVGKLFFAHSPFVYFSLLLCALVHWFLYRTRAGLVVRAVGESASSAHALGYRVIAIRYLAVTFGGTCAGLGGAYMAVAYTPLSRAGRVCDMETRTRSRRGVSVGGVTLVQFQAQAMGVAVPSQLLSMLPYLATIVVLTLISRDAAAIRLNAPASLGKPFHPDT